MKQNKILTILVLLIAAAAITASSFGIFSDDGKGVYEYQSIRGEEVMIYGKGIYKHMSADVAVQGIAQDYVTLLVGVPFLLAALFWSLKNSTKGMLLLSGTLLYFLVTYLFYLAMGMYNEMFLVYVFLTGSSFFAFVVALFSFDFNKVKEIFSSHKLMRNTGVFLIINSVMVALLWLGIIVPPLLDGSIYPEQLQHYTTLIVQGFDLALLLPISFVVGILAVRKRGIGYLFASVYVVFLSFLMVALTSKILFMANTGQNVVPVIFIMPTIALIAIIFSVLILRSIKKFSS
ncbi:MAG: hypothetical protein PHW27_05490 [Melioribacteraceae bacterium]|nr:hypothetical protein [Melioribacteraceae bacterium]MDD3558009.1 hypothetical protein [Melioribacteraceae bacterium]